MRHAIEVEEKIPMDTVTNFDEVGESVEQLSLCALLKNVQSIVYRFRCVQKPVGRER